MTGGPSVPAFRIETPRLLLRCWHEDDAPGVRQALDASDAHLRPWIPFMKDEPRTLGETRKWLAMHRENFTHNRHYRYGVFEKEHGTVIGENMLLDRVGEGGLEVGYWTHVDHGGRGFATEASSAMVRIGFEVHGVDRIEIHCAPENAGSAAVPAKLGFVHEATLKRRITTTDHVIRDLMIWTLFRADYAHSPAAGLPLAAVDESGKALL